MKYNLNRAWAEINLDNIAFNISNIRKLINKKTGIIGVVKADAYGHGVIEVSKTLIENGVEALAVSILDEAIQLRRIGIKVPILVLNYTDPKRAKEIVENKIIQTIFSYDLAVSISDIAKKMKEKVKIHIKIDTGMTRVGFMPGFSAVKNVIEINKLPNLIIEGMYTHFASADEKDPSYTKMQFEKFMSIINELKRVGILIPYQHVSNSAAAISYKNMNLDFIRPGIILYGLYPSLEMDNSKILLKPIMSLKANIVLVKEVEKGTCISYGRTYITKRKSKIATIPIGYADGYTRLLSGKGRVIISGQYAPIVGNICMDFCMVDITDIKSDIFVGDEVVLIGKQGENEITIDELSQKTNMINYEIACIIGKRIPRVYIKDGKVSKITNYLI